MMHCPSRREAKGYPVTEPSDNAAQPKSEAKTDYAANGGSLEAYLGTSSLWIPAPQPCGLPILTRFMR